MELYDLIRDERLQKILDKNGVKTVDELRLKYNDITKFTKLKRVGVNYSDDIEEALRAQGLHYKVPNEVKFLAVLAKKSLKSEIYLHFLNNPPTERWRADLEAYMLKNCSALEFGIIESYYGLFTEQHRSIEAIGKEYGYSREGARLVMLKGIKKLKRPMYREELQRLMPVE